MATIFWIVLSMLIPVQSVHAAGPSVYLEPTPPASLRSGDTFSSHLFLETSGSTFGFDVIMQFNTSQVSINSIQPSKTFDKPIYLTIDTAAGTVRYSRANLENVAPGKIDLGTVQITAKGGSGKIAFGPSSVTDSNGQVIEASTIPLAYTIISNGANTAGTGGGFGEGGTNSDANKAVKTTEERQNLNNCTSNGHKGLSTDFGCIPTDPAGFVSKFYGIGLGFIGGIALLFIMYGGYLIMTSQGNPSQLANGKSYVFYAIVGLLLAIFGYVFIQVVVVNVLHVPGFS